VRINPNAKKPTQGFKANGFDFERIGVGHFYPGFHNRSVYGIARGKMRYMKGTYCEAYPEVRDYWLEYAEKLIAMGVDGIDIRLQNHSGQATDFAAFGYNAPIVEAYREKYGMDILQEEADPMNIMRIRGEFFMEYLRALKKKLAAHDRFLSLHLRNALVEPSLSNEFGELAHWALPKCLPDWEEMVSLADEIVLKDYHFGEYKPYLSEEIKQRAHKLGKKVWVHVYLSQGGDLTTPFVSDVAADEYVTGVLLYEEGFATNPNYDHKGLTLSDSNANLSLYKPFVDTLIANGMAKMPGGDVEVVGF